MFNDWVICVVWSIIFMSEWGQKLLARLAVANKSVFSESDIARKLFSLRKGGIVCFFLSRFLVAFYRDLLLFVSDFI